MIRHACAERAALCDTLLQVGPDASTLCGDWTTGDLWRISSCARASDRAAGILAPPLAGRTEAAMAALLRDNDFETLVQRLRNGPPRWHPMSVPTVDEQANLVEMFVHHEDVLRAAFGAPRRSLDPALVSALGDRLAVMAKMLFRRTTGADLEIVTAKRRTRIGSGKGPVVEIHGRPGEIILFGFGRRAVAEVELIGPPETVEIVRTTRYGV